MHRGHRYDEDQMSHCIGESTTQPQIHMPWKHSLL